MEVEAVKRCAEAGECKGGSDGNTCSKATVDTKFKELSDKANGQPGLSHCVASCGCGGLVGCGCWYCYSGCLFYRTYAEVESTTTFEVFECIIWQFTIDVTISMHLASGKIISKKLTLKPGIEETWRNFAISLVGLIVPPSKLLHKQFITDGERTALVEASSSGQPVAGTIGELQCATREKAEAFKECYLAHEICQCDTQQESVKCSCTQLSRKIEPLFKHPEYVLPLESQGITIQNQDKRIEAIFNSIASTELQVSVSDLKLFYLHDTSTCNIKQISFKGCFDCISGAKLTFVCNTDFGDTLAHVYCGEVQFSTQCTTAGYKNSTILHFTTSEITQKCTIVCPAKETEFQLHGKLAFIEKDRLGEIADVFSSGEKKNNNWRVNAGMTG